MLKDIRPYVCILPDCKTPNALYLDGVSWVNHMRTDHTITKWKCSHTSHKEPLIFNTEVQFNAHAQSTHQKLTSDEALELAKLCGFQVPQELTAMAWAECPICRVSLDEFDFMSAYCHIANDLLDFAFYSLPDDPQLEHSQSLQLSSPLSMYSDDAATGQRRKSEAETDRLFPWSLWEGINSLKTKKDLQAYESDLIHPSFIRWKASQQLGQVWESIKTENIERLRTEPDPSLNLQREVIHYVPFPQNESFTGREGIMEQLKDMLFEHGKERVVLVGLGGMGKTQVALQLAYWAIEHQPQRHVIWVPAFSMAGIEKACVEVVQRLGIGTGDKDPKEVVQQYLSSETKSWLLIVDNVDDVEVLGLNSGEEEGIYKYLPQSDNGSVLFTTRSREVAVNIAGRDVVELREMGPEEARTLLGRLLIRTDQIQHETMVGKTIKQSYHAFR